MVDHAPGSNKRVSVGRVPFGFVLAFLGVFLPTVMVTSCDEIAAEVTVLDLATGHDAAVELAKARDALGTDSVPIDVKPWAVVLIVLIAAGVVMVAIAGETRRWAAIPIAIAALASLFLLARSVSIDVRGLLDQGGDFGLAGGSFVIAVGLWLAIVLACAWVIGTPTSTPFAVVNSLMLVGLVIAGASALGSPTSDFVFSNAWDLATPAAGGAALVSLAQTGGILVWRGLMKRRSSRLHRA